jgi:hypothetical protein
MFIRKTQTMIALVALATIAFAFRVAPSNFSGTWALNEGKSELGQFGARMADKKIVIDQKDAALDVTRTRAGMQGEDVTTRETLVEGKESEVTINNTIKKKSTLKWAQDGKSFTLDYTISGEFGGQPFEWKGTETWTISDDGKSFTVSSAFSTPQGDINTKAAYDKQ